jgi:alginate O-acetyltransferase complex protein AlgI
MLFCSQPFLLFFAAVFAAHWLLPWQRARVWLLLACSFGFYASWNVSLAGLICATTAADYTLARLIDRATAPRPRKLLLAASVVMNLGLLAYFKYANFFLQSLEEAVRAAGGSAALPVLRVVLPIGISFYTFEAISYTVDVYRRRIPAEKNLAHFMLFILFFPHLIAGPIVRARDYLPQIRRRKRWDWARLNLGLQLFLVGVVKKLVIADRLALLVDPVFADPARYSTTTLWTATLAWAIQVYCDFSGYTDMALGCAHMLGYKLPQNFDMPYLAANIAEFWRRWHITLGSWLRDYLYFPLGGSRCGEWKTARNLLITMLLAGLWHGAAWTYVVFGLLQAAMLIAHRRIRAFSNARPALSGRLRAVPGTALRVGFTFSCFCLTLVVFRAATLAVAGEFYAGMFRPRGGEGPPIPVDYLWYFVALAAVAHAAGKLGLWRRLVFRLPAPVSGFGYGLGLSLALMLAADSGRAFVYFQF